MPPQTLSYLLCLFLSTLPNNTLSLLLPCFRIQYSLNVADRLADEHVLIGLYVNMLRNNPSWLVQVWLLDCPERGEQSDLLKSSLSKGQSHWMPEVSLSTCLTDAIKISCDITLDISHHCTIEFTFFVYVLVKWTTCVNGCCAKY